ncbi:MAG: amphi-Trp domain-containing protein, partial [Ilumatobacteraceae bacterium]
VPAARETACSTDGEEDVMGDELLAIEETRTLRREEAAAKLRSLADQLSRHNQVEFVRGGIRHSVRVPDEVELSFEIEIGESTEIEIEIKF